MLFTTTTQYVVLALFLIAGWLFGLASHPGGRKWKERYADEREAHATFRKDHDGRVADLQKRNTELERENERLAKAPPAAAAPVATHADAARPADYSRDTSTRDTVTHADSRSGRYPRRVMVSPDDRSTRTGERRGWFNSLGTRRS